MNRRPILLASAALSTLLLGACDPVPSSEPQVLPLSRRVTWEGQPPLTYSVDSGQGLTLQDSLDGIAKIHTFDFRSADSLRLVLREFHEDFRAYRVFQEKALPAEIAEGFFRQKTILFFFHGPFFGELRNAQSGLVPASFLKDRLSIQGEELFRRPDVFRAFPLVGQIEASERVVSSAFLGVNGVETVFTMRYQCHGDTATLFRAFSPFPLSPESWLEAWKGKTDTLEWSQDLHFSGVQDMDQPLIFWIFKGGFLGVSGCYDPELALGYAEKLKKTTSLLNNP